MKKKGNHRNPFVVPMTISRKGGKMRDRRNRRPKNKRNGWERDYES